MENVTTTFGERLKLLRETAELTQQQLAEALKVSRGAISYYENGDRTPDIEFLESVAFYFGTNYDYLLGMTDNYRTKYRNMYEFYGLTDEACAKLEENDCIGHIISRIITNSDFFSIELMLSDIIEDYRNFDTSMINYFSFLLSNYLVKAISMALNKELNAQYTLDDRIAIAKEIEQFAKDRREMKKELEKIEAEIDEEIETECSIRDARIQNDPDTIRRKKVYDKLSRIDCLINE